MVNARLEATIRLRVRASDGSELDVEAVIDSGFTGSFTLPVAVIGALGLAHQSGGRAMLADGSIQQVDFYAADVDWDGSWRSVLVMEVGGEALVGMRLLAGHQVRFEVMPGGAVEVTRLP
ncbi:MAG: clan AA aspartic protease [Isosphaeraceae bacterium]